ncbi:hypothetical protein EGW08_023407, partial [Elysia chlorotica]
CGGVLSGDNGIITSPNYPNPYSNLERCIWSIVVEPGKVVRLNFHEFQVEAHPACDFDWVLVSDNRKPPEFLKCNVQCLMTFYFSFMFTILILLTTFLVTGYLFPDLPVCGGALSGDNGIITSPNYPKPYLNLERCFWSIAVEPGKVVRLTFHEFQVEAHPACDFDWVLV